MRCREPCDVLGHDVHLDVDVVAGALASDGGRGKCVRNYRHRDALVGHPGNGQADAIDRSEEHTSELQSLTNLVCRLLLEKKKNKTKSKKTKTFNEVNKIAV